MPHTEFNLQGKCVLITGGARGLGAAFARRLVDCGARVVIADVLTERGLQECRRLREGGGEAHFVEMDIGDPEVVERGVDVAVRALGGFDGLVNNAAIATGVGGRLFEDIDLDDWDRVMRVNVRGTWLVTRAALTHLKQAQGGGRIVNIASDTALWGAPRLMHYVASKGAVIAMTRAMAQELGDANICVNAIAPGLTEVEVTQSVPEERHELYRQNRALQRDQLPDDISGVVAFLLSDAAGFMTGTLLPVNGGFVMN